MGGSPVRLTLTVSHGAVSNVQVAALVTKGAAICAVNVGSTSFVFSKGKAKINRSHKFSGKLTDGHGDSMTITGLAKPARDHGVLRDQVDWGRLRRHDVQLRQGQVQRPGRRRAGGPHQVLGPIGAGFPISFRVSANGKAVDNLVVHYEVTTCGGSPGNSPPAYRFNALAIKSGSFSGSLTSRSGSRQSISLRITGTFFGRVATGTVTATQRITSLPTCTESESFTAKAK